MSFIHCNLRVLMAERGLNIQKVKDRTTLSRTTISNLYNNNGSGIKFETMGELCDLLDCTPGDLFSYIEMGTVFEVVTPKIEYGVTDETHIVDEEGNGYDYVSEIDTNLDIECHLVYEGKSYDLKFKSYVQYGIDEEKNMNKINIALSKNLHDELENILIPHAKKEFLDSLNEFLIDWGHDEFLGDLIEGVTHMSIYYGHLSDE